MKTLSASTVAADFANMAPAERHAAAIKCIHAQTDDGLDLEISRMAMRTCTELLSARVPCTLPTAEMGAAVTLLAFRWPSALVDETAQLMRQYIRADYFRLNNRVDAFGAEGYSTIFTPGRTPLEVAIRQGNIDAAVILIEEGDRFDVTPRTAYAAEPVAVDLLALARMQWSSAEVVATLREAAMRRCIVVGKEHALAPPAPHERRRLTV